jgi:hypothetical protein
MLRRHVYVLARIVPKNITASVFAVDYASAARACHGQVIIKNVILKEEKRPATPI